MKILAIIPARKGSKRVKNKNRKLFNGKPLIEYTIEEAKKSKYIDDIIVTTNDEIIYNLCKYHNVIANKRPSKLCKDDTPSQKVIDYIKTLYPSYDAYVLLQPTSPLRNAKHIDKCIKVFIENDFDCVITVKELIPDVFYHNGAVYVIKDKIITPNTCLILMSKEESIDIDTEFEFKYAEDIYCKL